MSGPAMLQHCLAVYEAMEAKAQRDGEGNLIFEGAGTKIIQEVGLSNPYYSTVMRGLKDMDCVRQIRRGGGGMGSIWVLLQKPSEALWNAHGDRGSATTSRAISKVTGEELLQAQKALLQTMAKLEQRVAILEAKAG